MFFELDFEGWVKGIGVLRVRRIEFSVRGSWVLREIGDLWKKMGLKDMVGW